MSRVLFTGGSVFDGTGAAVVPGEVAISDGLIDDAGVGIGRQGDEVVDATGLTILPGFIDTHTHVCLSTIDLMQNLNMPFSYQFYLAQKNLEKTLDIGITYARDASGADLGIQQAIEDGLIDGPALHISLIALSQTGGHGDHWVPSGNTPEVFQEYPGRPSGVIDGVDEARKRTRELLRMGANQIKVNTSGGVFSPRDNPSHPHFSAEELAVIIEEAARADSYVMAHAHGVEGIKAAIRAGVRSVEHGTQLDQEAIDMMVENGTWLVPTLGVGQFIIDRIEAGDAIAPAIAAKALRNQEMRSESFRKAVAAGVRIAMGSDAAAGSHGNNLIELRLMNEMGMAPLAVLESATRSGAQLMQIDDRVGTIAAGKQADLVLVSGDPLDFAAYPSNIRAVYRNGRQVRSYPA